MYQELCTGSKTYSAQIAFCCVPGESCGYSFLVIWPAENKFGHRLFTTFAFPLLVCREHSFMFSITRREITNMAKRSDIVQSASCSRKMSIIFLFILGCVLVLWFALSIPLESLSHSTTYLKWIKSVTTITSRAPPIYLDSKHQTFNKMCQTDASSPRSLTTQVLYHPGHDGHLGNKMFSMASLKGIGFLLRRKTILHNNTFSQLREKFPAVRNEVMLQQHDVNLTGSILVREKAPQCFEPDRLIWFLPEVNTVLLERYLQSWKYFYCIQDEIKQLFTFHKDILVKADKVLHQISQNTPHEVTFVGVHIRMGDVLLHSHQDPTSDRRVAPVHYIKTAMGYYRMKYPNVQFIVCTNDLEWIGRHYAQFMSNDTHLVTAMAPEEDMALLSRCNHSIMTIGI